jgi:hypothetical protein
MAATPRATLEELKKYPKMTRWFNPLLLSKLLLKVIVSDMFGQYADRRLVMAALDTVPEKELFDRTQLNFQADAKGHVWVDYVADLGDGFDATYAIASLMAQDTIEIGGETTHRGAVLIMGGDEVYPHASGENYRKRLRDPYDWALPDPDPRSDEGTPVYCIPGNHDWYDGLVIFLALFSRKELLHLGAWRSRQRRSYFALQLTNMWWIWCADTQLGDDVDQPQKEYFVSIASRMPEGSNIILCGPEPGWIYTRKNDAGRAVLDYLGWIARNADRDLKIPLILSGDTHHYSRYSSDDSVQFITSGGGGAFLHPTHQLEDSINMEWVGRNSTLSLKTTPSADHTQSETAACFPTRETSRKLLLGDLLFFVKNWDFSLLLGGVYWVLGMAIIARVKCDAYVISFIVLSTIMLGYFGYQEGWKRLKVYVSSLMHSSAHFVALVVLALVFGALNRELGLQGIWAWFFALAAELISFGAIFGGFIFGLNLLVTCGWADMNHNDAFSAMRLDSHRHFLRMRFDTDGSITIFPIALETVPKRKAWALNPAWRPDKPNGPAYVPRTKLDPKLIEGPVVVRAKI